MNQRRRKPVRKKDGTFNYNPDVYCSKYDETTGICGDGDDCVFLHRTAGDTERRYHLRYFKTCMCVHETDPRGHCVKNGAHCAFAHGAHDMRPPVYDAREGANAGDLDNLDVLSSSFNDSPLGTSLERDRLINEDPRWNDTNYVLANYKTEPCKRPPRLCRQGYACPSFHNTRDKRRSPKTSKYRSTPCPHVKHNDDWQDPTQCDNAEQCPYCHTRTEQQFHPEIYKSTKCNDMVQTGYCPRGPFCAFAHVEIEMTTQRDFGNCMGSSGSSGDASGINTAASVGSLGSFLQPGQIGQAEQETVSNGTEAWIEHRNQERNQARYADNSLGPIGRGRTGSLCDQYYASPNKAIGSDRPDDMLAKLHMQLSLIDTNLNLEPQEREQCKQDLLRMHTVSLSAAASQPSPSVTMPQAQAAIGHRVAMATSLPPTLENYYSRVGGDTVESVIGNALEEDLNLGDLNIASLDHDYPSQQDEDCTSVSSFDNYNAPVAVTTPQNGVATSTVPMSIPGGRTRTPQLPLSVSIPYGGGVALSNVIRGSSPISPQDVQLHRQEVQLQEAAAAFLSVSNPGKYAAPGYNDSPQFPISPSTNFIHSPIATNFLTSPTSNPSASSFDMHKQRQWRDAMGPRDMESRWKREAEIAFKTADELRGQKLCVEQQRDQALAQLAMYRNGGQMTARSYSYEPTVTPHNTPLNSLVSQDGFSQMVRGAANSSANNSLPQLTSRCMVCQDRARSVAVLPCNHCVLCVRCAADAKHCAYCNVPITHKTNVNVA